MIYIRQPYPNELYHHGIKGQKWGVRRFQNKDGSLTKAGRERYGLRSIKPITEKERFKNEDYLKRSSDTQKTVREIQRWNDKERLKIYKAKNLVAAKNLLSFKLSRINDDYDSKSKLPLKKEKTSIENDCKIVNPQYKSTKVSSSNNCELCTIAYDMRRRGYDVIARQNAPINLLYDISSQDLKHIYKNAVEKHTGSSKNLYSELSKQPNGSRGACFMSWGNDSGHVMAYEIVNGKPLFVDAQSGEINKTLDGTYPEKPRKTSYIRLDNVNPNYNLVRLAIE